MDMSKYASSSFIKVDDLAEGPQQETIVAIEEGRYDKPVLVLGDDTRLSLNGTNARELVAAFGANDKDWIGKRIELRAGTARFNGADTPSVLVRALDVLPAAERTPLPQPDDPDDEIPF
jgi:hypothetical protein